MKTSSILLLFIAFFASSCSNNVAKEGYVQSGKETFEGVKIKYIAHACFILEADTTKIMIDPYADRVWLGYDFPKGLKVDAVFITHPHYDHDGGIFRGKKPDWMCETDFYQSPNDYTIGDFKVSGIVGKHAEPYGKEFGQMNTIWTVEIGGIVFAHWGDNGPLTEDNIEKLQNVDVLFIPMDGDFHILPKEQYDLILNAIKPKIVVPMHYRIPELEEAEDTPKNLGEIEPFLKERPKMLSQDSTFFTPKIIEIKSNRLVLTKEEVPDSTVYYVFKHSPALQ